MAAKAAPTTAGYKFAQEWEKNAPLSATTNDVIAALNASCKAAENPICVPEQAGGDLNSSFTSAGSTGAKARAGGRPREDPGSSSEPSPLNSVQDWYLWFTELAEDADADPSSRGARDYAATLQQYGGWTGELGADLDAALAVLDSLSEAHASVAATTGALHAECTSLLGTQTSALTRSEAMKTKLAYFDELPRLTSALAQTPISVTAGSFLPLLNRLDECVGYMNANPHFKEARAYGIRFGHLQNKALTAVRSHAISTIQSTAAAATSAFSGDPGAGQAAESSRLYIKFRSVGVGLKSLLGELERRTNVPEYMSLLGDIQAVYEEQRAALLLPVLATKMQYSMAEQVQEDGGSPELPDKVRATTRAVLTMMEAEWSLWHTFFSKPAPALNRLLHILSTSYYTQLRRDIIHEIDIRILCRVAEILKVDANSMLQTTAGSGGDGRESGAASPPPLLRRDSTMSSTSGDSLASDRLAKKPVTSGAQAFSGYVRRLLQDTQERILFRFELFVRDELRGFVPGKKDLDYPDVLTKSDDGDNKEAGWYPTLHLTLALTSMLYRAMDEKTFPGLAQEAVEAVLESLTWAAGYLSKQAKKPPMHAQLFLIKHLLILRDELSVFQDVDLSTTIKALDFADVGALLSALLTRQTSLWSIRAPKIAESHVDSRKELEASLKTACEEFIMVITSNATHDLAGWIAKALGHKSVMEAKPETAGLDQQPWGNPEALMNLISSVESSVESELTAAANAVRQYIDNSYYHSILFAPVRNNLLDTLNQLRVVLESGGYAPDVLEQALEGISAASRRVEGISTSVATGREIEKPEPLAAETEPAVQQQAVSVSGHEEVSGQGVASVAEPGQNTASKVSVKEDPERVGDEGRNDGDGGAAEGQGQTDLVQDE